MDNKDKAINKYGSVNTKIRRYNTDEINKDKELRRLDKIAKLELMIEEYGLEGFMKIFFEAYDNTMGGVVTKFNINIETTKKTIKDNE